MWTAKFIFLIILIINLMACKTLRPGEMPITERDAELYENYRLSDYSPNDSKSNVAIICPFVGHPIDDEIQKTIESELSSAASTLAYFNIIPRSEISSILDNINIEQIKSTDLQDINVPMADYLLIGYVVSRNLKETIRSFPNQYTGKVINRGYYEGEVIISIRMYEVPTQLIKFSQTFQGNSSILESLKEDMTPSMEKGLMTEATRNALSKYLLIMADKYSPEAFVMQTRGKGRVAMISLGSEYGIDINQEVEFFYYDETLPGFEPQRNPVGYGKIIQIEKNYSWAQVINYKKVRVLKGHRAKLLSRRSRSFSEKFIERLN